MNSAQPLYEDEIDLREIAVTLLKYKWIILIITLVFAIAAFLTTKLILPKEYQATAYVLIVKPSTTTDFDSHIQTTTQLPDSKSILDLTKADDLVYVVYHSPQVEPLFKDYISLGAFKNKLSSVLTGSNQLRLSVTDTDPERVATIANIWAEQVTARLNALLDTDIASLDQIKTQVEEARLSWDAAEQALLDYLPQSDLDALKVSLSQKRSSLENTLNEIDSDQMLIGNARLLKARFETKSSNDPISIDNALSLVTLQQKAIGQLRGASLSASLQFQVTGADLFNEQYTVADARSDLDTLVSALQTQVDDLNGQVSQQTADITTQATELEDAQYQIDQLTVQRDLNLEAYKALSSHEVEVKITLSQNDQAAKIAGEALPPEKPSGPRSLINTAIAGAAGFVLAILAVLVLNWWKTSA
jgi:succinoglycan biosynthesis transport protein ExoP